MKKLTSSIVIALLTLSSCVNKSAMQDPVRIPLYEMEEAGSKYYRIPALTQAADGALVAIADKRGDVWATCRTSSASCPKEVPMVERHGATCRLLPKVIP